MLYPLSYEGGRGSPSVAGSADHEVCGSTGPVLEQVMDQRFSRPGFPYCSRVRSRGS